MRGVYIGFAWVGLRYVTGCVVYWTCKITTLHTMRVKKQAMALPRYILFSVFDTVSATACCMTLARTYGCNAKVTLAPAAVGAR